MVVVAAGFSLRAVPANGSAQAEACHYNGASPVTLKHHERDRLVAFVG